MKAVENYFEQNENNINKNNNNCYIIKTNRINKISSKLLEYELEDNNLKIKHLEVE